MTLGENIRKHRERLGMTMTTLAGEANCTIGAISQFESNRTIPNAYTFALIAKALHVQMDELMYGKREEVKG